MDKNVPKRFAVGETMKPGDKYEMEPKHFMLCMSIN